ncbi:MAG: TIM barrel protein [Bacteroidota bacterium]
MIESVPQIRAMDGLKKESKMPLGLGSYALAWSLGVPGKMPKKPLSAFEFIDMAKSLDLTLVQMDDNIPLHNYTTTELNDLKHHAYQQGIAVEVGTRKLETDHILNYLDIAKEFASPFLRVVIDAKDYEPEPTTVISVLKSVMPSFEKAGVYLALENHDRFTAATFVDIITKTASEYVKICLDSVNSLGAGEGVAEVTKTLAPHVINLHLKEYQIARVWHNMGFTVEGRPLGQGQLPLAWMLSCLPADCLSATLELWPAPEANLEQTITKEQNWVKESVHYWKTHFAH